MIWKKAAKAKLRIQTTKGLLTPEQLWGLSLKDLDELAVKLEDEKNASGKRSFLSERSEADATKQLELDIVMDVLIDKVAAQQAEKNEAEKRIHNSKIDDLIAKKQDEELGNLSIEELKALRK